MAQIVKPVSSASHKEARKAVLRVYKEVAKATPTMWWDLWLQGEIESGWLEMPGKKFSPSDIPLPVFRELLKKQFLKHKDIQDIRIIDRKVRETKEASSLTS